MRNVLLGVWLGALPALADGPTDTRAAVLFSANGGLAHETPLRYADSDARRVALALREGGGFLPERIREVSGASADGVRRVLLDLAQKGGEEPLDLLVVFYSGHADATSLHLSGTELPSEEFRRLVAAAPARAKVLIVDACRSGGVVRRKGGRVIPAFEVSAAVVPEVEGLAVLTSSAHDEASLESDELEGSLFTHALVTGLLGAADGDQDGAVSLAEAFDYSARSTLAASARTPNEVQHPTYEVDLRGTASLVLTRPFREGRRGILVFEEPGHYLVRKQSEEGRLIAEVRASEARRRLRLEPGAYFVTQRRPDSLRQGTVVVGDGELLVQPSRLQAVEYARAVRKGGVERSAAFNVVVLGNARWAVFGLWQHVGVAMALRLDLRSVAVEVRGLWLPTLAWTNERLTTWTDEVGVSVAGIKTFDLRWLSLGIGAEVGPTVWFQRFSDRRTPPRRTLGLGFGPLLQIDSVAWRGWFARAEFAPQTVVVQESEGRGVEGPPIPRAVLGLRLAVGAGVSF